jgi:hypothetical protein
VKVAMRAQVREVDASVQAGFEDRPAFLGLDVSAIDGDVGCLQRENPLQSSILQLG